MQLFTLLFRYVIDLFPEESLILHLCRFQICKDDTSLVHIRKLLTKKIRWKRMSAIIQENKLWGSAIHWQEELRKAGVVFPQNFVSQCLTKAVAFQYVRNFQKDEAKQILQLFLKQKINFVVMKSFIISYTPRWGASKISHDIDILIPPSQFAPCASILLSQGYTYRSVTEEHIYYPLEYIDFYVPQSQECFQKGDLTVELHTSIVDTYNFLNSPWNDKINKAATQELYKESYVSNFFGVPTRTFSETSLFISLFLHSFFQHNLQGGYQFLEAAKLLNYYHDTIDWKYVISYMRKYKIQKYLYWFLCLLDEIFSLPLPPKVRGDMRKNRESFGLLQVVMLFYMKCKILHPTTFLNHPKKEIQKKWCWAIIDQKVLSLFKREIQQKLRLTP